MMERLLERLATLRQTNAAVQLYAVVDGLQYEEHTGRRLSRESKQRIALFDGTPDQALAHAGPWLVDPFAAPQEEQAALISTLDDLDRARPSVVWLMTDRLMVLLWRELTQRLEAKTADGKPALLRWYDPRVLASLAQVLEPDQREMFFGLGEWHFFYQGRRARIGR